jgi:translocation and assembly module TamA
MSSGIRVWPCLGLCSGLLSVVLASGCSSAPANAGAQGTRVTVGGDARPGAVLAPESPASAAQTDAVKGGQVVVVAPPPLKALLERHLDLIRLTTFAAKADISGAEWDRLIDATPSQVGELLQTEGYFDPKVTVTGVPEAGAAQWSEDSQPIRVVVEPGPLSRVSRVDLEFEGDLARLAAQGDPGAREMMAELRAGWPLAPGVGFRNAEWSDAKTRLLTRLRAAGYANATWAGTTAQVDAPRQRVRLYLVADTGPLFRSGELVIDGLVLHDQRAVANLAGIDPGTPLTDTLLLDFQDRLLKSGLFEQASVTLDTESPDPGRARLRVRVTELARHQLTLGLGVSSNAGPRATVEHIDRRLYGWPATARNKAEWGRTRQAWDGELSTHVREDRYRWFIGGTIERLKTDEDVVLSQRLRAGRAFDSARIERIQFVEWDRATRRTALARTVTEALTANHGWVWRDIDNPLLPTDGQTLSLNLAVGQARSNTQGSAPLARAQGRLTAYRPLGGGWFGQARVEAGQVFVRDAALVTDSLGFRAGGDESVRGYAYRSLGPVRDGAVGSGQVLLTGSVEVARPLASTLPSVWGAVFVDAGDAADSWSALGLAVGTGVGLRWRSPVGPLKLDLAYGHAVKKPRLHFSVGIVF